MLPPVLHQRRWAEFVIQGDGPQGADINDPFVQRFFARIPSDLADTFTSEQILAVKMAFGARSWGSHAVDIRTSFPLPGWRGYLVVLAGREKRSRQRLAEERQNLLTVGNSVFLTLAALCFTAGVGIMLYLVKSFFGIDLMPDTSLGLWGIVKEQFAAYFG